MKVLIEKYFDLKEQIKSLQDELKSVRAAIEEAEPVLEDEVREGRSGVLKWTIRRNRGWTVFQDEVENWSSTIPEEFYNLVIEKRITYVTSTQRIELAKEIYPGLAESLNSVVAQKFGKPVIRVVHVSG